MIFRFGLISVGLVGVVEIVMMVLWFVLNFWYGIELNSKWIFCFMCMWLVVWLGV